MASNWNVIGLICTTILISACSGSKSVQKEPVTQTAQEKTPIQVDTTAQQIDFDIELYRNTLADPSSQKSNTLPPAFVTEVSTTQQSEMESNAGFRIQLISTSDRSRAQKMVADFNDWLFSNEKILYKAETYIIFKQPNYRVHVGDFKTRIQASEFIKSVKRRFSDAWIIQDSIIDERTPDKMK